VRPLQLLDRWGFCPFCVSIRNYQSIVEARYRNGPAQVADDRILTRPVQLTEWLHERITEDFAEFRLDDYASAFVPVAVIAGVPLCPTHLWIETDPATRRLRA
jgi:hypothetical protein